MKDLIRRKSKNEPSNGRHRLFNKKPRAPGTTEECVESIKRCHRAIISKSGEAREEGLEDAILNEFPLQSICEMCCHKDDPFERAAFALEYVAVFHPFAEGNKRTAVAVCEYMLRLGGYTLPDTRATYEFVRDVASGGVEREQIEAWLRKHAVSSP